MKLRKLPLAVAMIAAMGGGTAAYAVPELEPNNTFAERDLLAPGVLDYQGELSPGTAVNSGGGSVSPFFSTSGTLNEGAVDYFTVAGLNESDDVQIFLNNAPAGSTNTPDTVLGVFDDNGALLASDTSYSSGQSLQGNFVSPTGNLTIGVSGWPDYDFDGDISSSFGAHQQSGDYELSVFVNAPDVDPWGDPIGGFNDFIDEEMGQLIEGDVDFVQFTGLMPGEMFRVELLPEPPAGPNPGAVQTDQEPLFVTGGMIGLFDDGGTLVAADQGWDGSTVLGGIVPASGQINVAVTGAEDDGNNWSDDGEAFNGISMMHDTGGYDLVVETFNLADPGADLGDLVRLPDDPQSQDNPCAGAAGCFGFGDLVVEGGEIVNLDPDVAVGYTFKIVSGPTGGGFSSVLLPAVGADTDFWISVAGCGTNDGFDATAGVLYNFMTQCGVNVSTFEVLNIDINEGLDPTNPTAFVTQVTFSEAGNYDTTMIAKTVWVPEGNSVPEPASLALFSIGLVGFGFAGRGRKRSS